MYLLYITDKGMGSVIVAFFSVYSGGRKSKTKRRVYFSLYSGLSF